jgi:hypothetical protein
MAPFEADTKARKSISFLHTVAYEIAKPLSRPIRGHGFLGRLQRR